MLWAMIEPPLNQNSMDDTDEIFYDAIDKEPDFKTQINTFVNDMTYHQLTGKSQTFNIMVFALQSLEKLQNLEAILPNLAWSH